MDKLKPFLAQLKKHHFWVLASLIPLIALATWFVVTGGLAKKAAASIKTIDGKFSTLDNTSADAWPGPKVVVLYTDAEKQAREQVLAAWKMFYDRQAEILEWPADVIEVANLTPEEQIPEQLRRNYQNFVIQEEWDRLWTDVANARREKVGGGALERRRLGNARRGGGGALLGGGGAGGGGLLGQPGGGGLMGQPGGMDGAQQIQMEGMVAWDRAMVDQFIARYKGVDTPSTVQMRMTQEDLWLFENMLKVIADTNKSAKDVADATVKQINVIEVAQWAVLAAQSDSTSIGSGGGGNRGGGLMGGGGMMGGGAALGGAAGLAGGGGAMASSGSGKTLTPDEMLVNGRYLDALGEPLEGDKQPFAEFKQVFVYMNLMVDQRKLPELLTNCANAPLTIEVRQVRISGIGDHGGGSPRRGGGGGGLMGGGGLAGGGGLMGGGGGLGGVGATTGGGGGLLGGGGGGGGLLGGGGGGAGGLMGGGGGGLMGGGRGGARASSDVALTEFDATVSICGVCYFYNKPDPEKLATGTAADPAKRQFAIPTKPVTVPLGGSGGAGAGGLMGGGAMGGGAGGLLGGPRG